MSKNKNMCTTTEIVNSSPNWVETIKFIGGLAGLIAFSWSIFEELRAYLKIKVQAEKKDDLLTIFTEVENERKFKSKKIDNAFLIITKEESDVINDACIIRDKLGLKFPIKYSNDFKDLKSKVPLYIEKKVAFIPLTYYYDENLWVGDERLAYRCSINISDLEEGTFSVRFYIFKKRRYHRSIQDLFKI